VISGLPGYHPLLKDADERLAALRRAMDGFAGKYCTLTPGERLAVAGNTYEPQFGPDIAPLGRSATPDDVKAGKAIFHLEGNGTPAKMELPARGTWKRFGKGKEARHCLIVQAEVRADGEILCTIIERHAIRAVPAREFAAITPLAKTEAQ